MFHAAVAAVNPTDLVARHLSRAGREVVVEGPAEITARWPLPLLVLGAGKAAARMAAGCEAVLGAENVSGEVVVADGCEVPLQSIAVSVAGHPLPDARGERGAASLIQRLDAAQPAGCLCLISGGASSLLVRPRPPVTLRDKIRTTELLLECGADIHEFNTVRKHLSEVKGGGLLRYGRAPMVGFILSDVVGDDPSTIGSGPTTPDRTTFEDAWAVLERYHIVEHVPASVTDVLRRGMRGAIPETVKPDCTEARRCSNLVIGSNRTAIEGGAQEARSRGWAVVIRPEPLDGDSTVAAHQFAAYLMHVARVRTAQGPLCVFAGGETTVHVSGKGRGGRNQEFALALAEQITGTALAVLSAGTDGIDGPTDAAGAFVDGTTLRRARERGLDPAAALADNDSYTFFAQLGDLFRCGPTGTNVMDVKIALLPERRRR
jgi:hydroxypyruvate reductase